MIGNVPQGLPTTVTACLFIVAERMGKHNVFVKKLDIIETLGSCTLICTGEIIRNFLFYLLNPAGPERWSVLLSVCLSVCTFVCLSFCLSVCLSVCLYVCLSVLLSVCLCICLSVFVSFRLSVYRTCGQRFRVQY